MIYSPKTGDYVSYQGYPEVVLRVRGLKFNGGNPLAEIELVGVKTAEDEARWRRACGYAASSNYFEPYANELSPANEMLVIALASKHT